MKMYTSSLSYRRCKNCNAFYVPQQGKLVLLFMRKVRHYCGVCRRGEGNGVERHYIY